MHYENGAPECRPLGFKWHQMENAVSIFRAREEGHEAFGTHPPSSLRRRFLWENILPEMMSDENVASAQQLGNNLESIISYLWAQTRPRLLALRRAGIKASSVWR